VVDETVDESYASHRILGTGDDALGDHLKMPRQDMRLVSGIDAPDLRFEVDSPSESTSEFRREQ
jgi:hypothetical protein